MLYQPPPSCRRRRSPSRAKWLWELFSSRCRLSLRVRLWHICNTGARSGFASSTQLATQFGTLPAGREPPGRDRSRPANYLNLGILRGGLAPEWLLTRQASGKELPLRRNLASAKRVDHTDGNSLATLQRCLNFHQVRRRGYLLAVDRNNDIAALHPNVFSERSGIDTDHADT